MPLLFSLGIDPALKEGRRHLVAGEQAFAFLDDVYLLVHHSRAAALFATYSELIERHAGVRTHLGKTRCWRMGDPPRPRACPSVRAR